ncbi:MAG: glycosyltransferase [Thermus sp.]|uniref:glycosyltransferase n=1 Tax=Thermus TaxID=270 RepID=UPI001FA9FDF1|nr:glycosyltransferase [Thermus thalpophilus]
MILAKDMLAIRPVFAVTVTYGDRFSLVQRVVEGALKAGVDRVVIVDNASEHTSAEALREFASHMGSRVVLLRQPENLGSAGGFARGIQYAFEAGAEFLWLLDDDNLPDTFALERLALAYAYLGSNPLNVLSSFRLGQSSQARILVSAKEEQLRPNAFMTIHIATLPQLLSRFFHRPRAWTAFAPDSVRFPLVPVPTATYGGLFFHRTWVERVGLPNEALYLYMDDIEYSLRFAEKGGKLYLCAFSLIRDLTPSWNEGDASPWFSPQASETRLYYILRNAAWLGRKRATILPLYLAHVALFFVFFFLGAIKKRLPWPFFVRRLRLYIRAVRDGLRNRLGHLP